jgi:membrane protease YdiL (CAAX protease family)
MDTNSLLCVIEVLGIILVAIAAAVIRNWASFRQSFETMGETTRATRPQWASILAGVLGANIGYIILVGAYSLHIWLEDPTAAESFLIPASVAVYLFCAIPTYLPVGAICGLILYRYTQRKSMESRVDFIIAIVVSAIIGAIIAIPIYLVGLTGAAL